MARRVQKRRFQGLAPYMFSIVLILLPAFVFYFLHVRNQTNYHQSRSFRALGEISSMMDNNLEMLKGLHKLGIVEKTSELDTIDGEISELEGKLEEAEEEKTSSLTDLSNPTLSTIN